MLLFLSLDLIIFYFQDPAFDWSKPGTAFSFFNKIQTLLRQQLHLSNLNDEIKLVCLANHQQASFFNRSEFSADSVASRYPSWMARWNFLWQCKNKDGEEKWVVSGWKTRGRSSRADASLSRKWLIWYHQSKASSAVFLLSNYKTSQSVSYWKKQLASTVDGWGPHPMHLLFEGGWNFMIWFYDSSVKIVTSWMVFCIGLEWPASGGAQVKLKANPQGVSLEWLTPSNWLSNKLDQSAWMWYTKALLHCTQSFSFPNTFYGLFTKWIN